MSDIPENREDAGRNPDGTFKPGVSGNPGGRPRSSIKDYLKMKFSEMTPQEKDEFIKLIPPEMQWRMAEGNPSTNMEVSGEMTKKIIRIDE